MGTPERQRIRSQKMNLSRRHLLKVGGLGLLVPTIPKLLRPEALTKLTARAKSVIFLFQWGGPSHIDMFDRKPNAPAEIRGPLGSIDSRCPGLQLCEQLPQTARRMDKVTIIRTLTHTMKNHNSAGYYALSGHAPPS